MKKVIFIDRDGTIIQEPQDTFQIDSIEKLEFLPSVISSLAKIKSFTDYELVLITNQDGLGTDSFPEKDFWPAQNAMLKALASEGIVFQDILIDRSFESEGKSTRKPGLGLLQKYLDGSYDLKSSWVIGDRLSDIQLAKNLGAQGVFIVHNYNVNIDIPTDLADSIAIKSRNWVEISELLLNNTRITEYKRHTKETKIDIKLNLDGTGKSKINTGIAFFDHMLDQIARHGLIDLEILCKGDLEIDEHHTIEDVGISLGEAFSKAIGNKTGIERYGFTLPMDDCLAQVALDFGGRNWIVWEAEFKREKVGEMPTEMFFHFFKSFSDGARCNLNIKAEGSNEHHKIEAIFKAFAKAIKMAVKRDLNKPILPSTKGLI